MQSARGNVAVTINVVYLFKDVLISGFFIRLTVFCAKNPNLITTIHTAGDTQSNKETGKCGDHLPVSGYKAYIVVKSSLDDAQLSIWRSQWAGICHTSIIYRLQ